MSRKDSIDTGELTDSDLYILSSVIEEKHGYLIMKTIESLTNNEVTIGSAFSEEDDMEKLKIIQVKVGY